jgi:maleate cis-trans isomerase
VSPVVSRGPGFANELAERLSQAYGLPVITDMFSVIEARAT